MSDHSWSRTLPPLVTANASRSVGVELDRARDMQHLHTPDDIIEDSPRVLQPMVEPNVQHLQPSVEPQSLIAQPSVEPSATMIADTSGITHPTISSLVRVTLNPVPHFTNEALNLAMDIIFARERSLFDRRHSQTAISRASSVNPYNVQTFDVFVTITMRVSKLMSIENFAQELNDTFIFESAAFTILIAQYIQMAIDIAREDTHLARTQSIEQYRAKIETLWQHINFLYVPICKFCEYGVQCSAVVWESVNQVWRAYASICEQYRAYFAL